MMKTCQRRMRLDRGFTLVELMIVVAIVAILAAVAYPSYTRYVQRSHRTQLMADIAAAQQWLERSYSETYLYPTDTVFQQQAFSKSPQGGGRQQYTLAISSTSATARQDYTLTVSYATGSTMNNDDCGRPTVTNTGVKGLVASSYNASLYPNAADALAACWR